MDSCLCLTGCDPIAQSFVSMGVVVVAVVVVVLTLTRILKPVVTGQAPVSLELRNTQGRSHTTQGGTRIYHS